MKLRNHAVQRIYERCQLNPHQVKSMLKNGQYHPIGLDKKHQHQLIYSEKDDECFVVVLDFQTNEIITVLPINYHSAWMIHQDAIDLAKRAYYGEDAYGALEDVQKAIKDQTEKDAKDELAEIRSQLPVKKISIVVSKITLVPRAVQQAGKSGMSRKSQDTKLCTMKDIDFIRLGFPRDMKIERDTILREYMYNIEFANSIICVVKNSIAKLSIESSETDRYYICLQGRDQFEIKLAN